MTEWRFRLSIAIIFVHILSPRQPSVTIQLTESTKTCRLNVLVRHAVRLLRQVFIGCKTGGGRKLGGGWAPWPQPRTVPYCCPWDRGVGLETTRRQFKLVLVLLSAMSVFVLVLDCRSWSRSWWRPWPRPKPNLCVVQKSSSRISAESLYTGKLMLCYSATIRSVNASHAKNACDDKKPHRLTTNMVHYC